MALFLQQRQARKQEVIDSYYEALIETEKYREKEKQAAIDIQKNWRMLKVKWHYQTILKSCRLIQRVFQGYSKGRKVFFRKQESDKRQKQLAFFHEMAKIVQKYYRGYYSRKYEHDFYARKNYLNHVQEKNEEVRKKLEDYQKTLSLEEQKRQEATARTEFAELAGNLHHLCSTKAIPGVYNAPYAMVKPQAFNVEIETHLRSTFKANYQWKPPNKEKIEFFRTLSQEQQKIMQQQKITTR
ncbi:iq calmodulin-binding motif family protein [Stylonychia lemnae]|uniref:Iq calmodulin-binding motif family protein n=1 Tax=Stylonychia lemnae TaxID=5949 RepID=A0A078AE14_STYLE|nr:iq calmodulin-binding motif family protein [Stylonychia lemnae]|eukprot:CDW79153.1 iq calmodulin-binding motif family protein [Stylonychia lemnae]